MEVEVGKKYLYFKDFIVEIVNLMKEKNIYQENILLWIQKKEMLQLKVHFQKCLNIKQKYQFQLIEG